MLASRPSYLALAQRSTGARNDSHNVYGGEERPVPVPLIASDDSTRDVLCSKAVGLCEHPTMVPPFVESLEQQ